MSKPSDFHPSGEENFSGFSLKPQTAQILEILEKGSDSEEEDTPQKPGSQMSNKVSECDKTTQEWIQNKNINQKHVVNVTFDDSFKGKPGAFEEDEAISIKPLFLETMGK